MRADGRASTAAAALATPSFTVPQRVRFALRYRDLVLEDLESASSVPRTRVQARYPDAS